VTFVGSHEPSKVDDAKSAMQDMSALRAGSCPTSKELAIGSWFAEVALEKSD
jgi:hypothetical protein